MEKTITSPMETHQSQSGTYHNIAFQVGLLHFVHLLMMADGDIDTREKAAIRKIKLEEKIPDWVFDDFEESAPHKIGQQIYDEGVTLLNTCTEEEKLTVFVHLYRLSEADENIHEKEVKFLLYSLKDTNIEYADVVLGARMSKAVQLRWL
jgi:uncharacterized tellurite resistance protein B-like protein